MSYDLLFDGLRFPEGSRWHNGRLVFSDMHTGQIFTTSDAGELSELTRIDDQPSGLGWLPDGSMLISSMLKKRIMRLGQDGELTVYADLADLVDHPVNDMVIDDKGNAYVGSFGYDIYAEAPKAPAPVIHVAPDGSARIAAEGFDFPNGSIIIPGTNTIVIGETWGSRCTAFEIAADGSLVNRRVWAELSEDCNPDGACVDSEGGMWLSSVLSGEFVRVVEGGEITQRIPAEGRLAVDCVLGGADGRTLYMLTADSWTPSVTAETRAGRIETVRVDIAGPLS